MTYLGKIPYNGEIIEGCHEAIIDQNTFDRVQEEHRKRSSKNTTSSPHLLTGLIYCGKCGARYRYQKWGKDGMKLVCYSQQPSKPNLVRDPDCNNARYDAADIEEAVINDLLRKTKNIKVGKSILNKRSSASDVLEKRYDELSAKIKRLYNLYASKDDDLLLETIEENKAELNNIIKAINDEERSNSAIEEINHKQEVITNLVSAWPAMTIKEKQQALRICIDRIVLNNNEVNIEYTFN